MEYYICIIILIITIFLTKWLFKINLKKLREINENVELSKITDKFPDNITIAKDYLEMLNNKDANIEEAKDTKTSLYIAVTNKIMIADMKDNYSRLQTIAHECLHACQDKALLLFNFIFSNLNILYFLIAIFLTVIKVFDNIMFHTFILTFLLFIQFSVRSFLEIDAMTRAKFLCKEYMEIKQLADKKETEKVLTEYERVNKIAIPFTIYTILTNAMLMVLIYVLVGIFI